MIKYSKSILIEKRTIKEAELFCQQVFSSKSDKDFRSFRLKQKNGKDDFNKYFWEEYSPLSLYSSLKYPKKEYLIFLCGDGSKTDAKIIASNNKCVENIQITTASFDSNYARKNKKLLNEGHSLGTGKFIKEKDGSISQSRGLRSEEIALKEESDQIIKVICKKIKNTAYENIDVLLVATESRFNNVIPNYYKKMKKLLRTELENKSLLTNNKFKDIFLIDLSSKLVKLS